MKSEDSKKKKKSVKKAKYKIGDLVQFKNVIMNGDFSEHPCVIVGIFKTSTRQIFI